MGFVQILHNWNILFWIAHWFIVLKKSCLCKVLHVFSLLSSLFLWFFLVFAGFLFLFSLDFVGHLLLFLCFDDLPRVMGEAVLSLLGS